MSILKVKDYFVVKEEGFNFQSDLIRIMKNIYTDIDREAVTYESVYENEDITMYDIFYLGYHIAIVNIFPDLTEGQLIVTYQSA